MIEKLYLGTYTDDNVEGIYTVELDTEKKQLQNKQLFAKESNPTYLAKSNNGNLYAVYDQQRMGGVAGYTPDGKLINHVLETGAPICYIAVDDERHLAYGANYHKGELNVYAIEPSGALKTTESLYHHEKTGPHKNQDAPHVHYTDLTPDGRLIVCDLGTDGVYVYDVSDQGTLSLTSLYHAQPGTGPRHLTFNPNKRFAYVVGELDSTVSVMHYSPEGDLTFVSKQTIKPGDWHDFNSGAAIRFHAPTNTLYVSNRGYDSLAVFHVSDTGDQLELIQQIHTEGHFPRDFNIDPSDQFIVVGHQFSDNLSLFEIDQVDGTLTLVDASFNAPATVGVTFDTAEKA